MSGIGTGYDIAVNIYSPEGRVFQVEYATKAVENSSTTIGICCKDGVVFGVDKVVLSKMLEKGSGKRLFTVDSHIGMACSGLVADARQLVNRARAECRQYKDILGIPMTGQVLSDRLSGFIHLYTTYGWVRPFGVTTMIGTMEREGSKLYMIEPSGTSWGYHGCVAGKNKRAAKTEIEKLNFDDITCREALQYIVKTLLRIRDETKKEFDIELSWVCEETDRKHRMVPEELAEQLKQRASEELEAEEESSDEEEEEEEMDTN
eukprot:gb/GECH01012095.1/.p1 GENE.gb/GECH01012095.1/~~gb/GECH01012095.1/.p1  ORF type:complete len:262 (+),score=80.79 gb/GECH01012095.1/:1-786(+)